MTDRTVPRGVMPLLFSSMAIFVITVVMGILYGTDLVDLPHGALLAHVHAGTLGWITLSIFAAAAWILGSAGMPRLLRNGAIAAVALYVATFWINIEELRPIAGALMLAVIIWFAVWAFQPEPAGRSPCRDLRSCWPRSTS
jgi:cbb3-type cytochrome oxidase subunit 1